MDCNILHMFLLETIFIAIICYHYSKHRLNKKKYWYANNEEGTKMMTKMFYSIMLSFGKMKVGKEDFYGAKINNRK